MVLLAVLQHLLEGSVLLPKHPGLSFPTLGYLRFSLQIVVERPDLLLLVQVLPLVPIVLLSQLVQLLSEVTYLLEDGGIPLLALCQPLRLHLHSVLVFLDGQNSTMHLEVFVLELSLVIGFEIL